MNYQYTYFLIGIGFAVIWLAIFLFRKDTRKEVLIMSIIFGILGPVSNSLFIKDWWQPLTIDGTGIGFIESLFVGFVIGGVVGVIYEIIFKKIDGVGVIPSRKEHLLFFLMAPLSLAIFFGGFYLLGLNSFIASCLALFIPAAVILIRRRDLLPSAFLTGIITVILAILVYNFVNLLTPNWVEKFWYFRNVPHLIILNLPIDDVVHYFLLGLFGGPLYEYWKGTNLVRLVNE